jgi:hypothetical protein
LNPLTAEIPFRISSEMATFVGENFVFHPGIEDEPTFAQVLSVNNQLNVTLTQVTYYTTERDTFTFLTKVTY